MDIAKIKARPRGGTGKSYVRKMREQGWIPGVYYGHNRESVSIEVDCKALGAVLRNQRGTHLYDLGLTEKEGDSVAIIKEIQRDTLIPGHIVHIDFQHADMNEPVTIECPVHILGEAVGALEQEGVLNHPVQHLTVHCLPAHIPERIEVDVSHLNVGDAIHVKDLSIPNVEFRASPEEVIASVTHASKVEEEVPAEEVEGEEGAEGEAGEGEGGEAGGKEGEEKAEESKEEESK